jgi:hypothetical protein
VRRVVIAVFSGVVFLGSIRNRQIFDPSRTKIEEMSIDLARLMR